MDAQAFLGMKRGADNLHWHMPVRRDLSTPEGFLFGGCALGAALVALESAGNRPTVWATGHYVSYAATDSILQWEVKLAAVGRQLTHGRAVARIDGSEILTVNAALGINELEVRRLWVEPPKVRAPTDCPPRVLPAAFLGSINETFEVRAARGRHFEEIDGTPGEPDSAMWIRVPSELSVSTAILAIVGDYIPGAVSEPLGRRAMARSLDNTLRVVQLKSTEWILCDIRIHALVGRYAHGAAFLWSEDGGLLAIANQSMAVRLRPEDGSLL